MFDPFDSAFYRMIRQIQRDQAMLRGSLAYLPALDRLRIEQQTALTIRPHYYSALESITKTLERGGTAALVAQINRGGWLTDSALNLDRSLARVIADQRMLESAANRSFGSTFQLIESLNHAHALATKRSLDVGLLAGLGQLQGEAAFALGMQARIEESIRGSVIHPRLYRLVDRLTTLAGRGERIWDRYANRPALLLSTPDFIREAPTRLIASASRSTGLVLTADEAFIEETGGILSAEANDIEERLIRVHLALAEPYRGALKTFRRREDDYIRQTAASLRELFVHLLREVAPEAAIAAWDQSVLPEKGKVTYKAQLAYTFRAVTGSKAYGVMANNDIEHVLQNFYLLEGQGVHKLTSDLEYEEVGLLVRRCEYSLLLILRAHELSVAAS